MRITYLTAGGAGMFCGSCMHDNTLSSALIDLGHDVQLIPLYTPIRTDEQNVSINKVFLGGINVFLQQKVAFFRQLPPFLDGWLNHPRIINRITSKRIPTNPQELGAITVSMLKGESGHQKKELLRLTNWLSENVRPSLVNLTNILIGGCIPAIKKQLGVPVFVTLQGDDLFLDSLPSPQRDQAMIEVRRLAAEVDGFITFSQHYADFMSDYLKISRNRIQVVPLGIRLEDFVKHSGNPKEKHPPTIGYFARICPEKGFHLLVEAFLLLRKMRGTEKARLKVGGWLAEKNTPFFQEQLQKLRQENDTGIFEYVGAPERREKVDFFREVDVCSVPTTYPESKGLFVLESLASGVPVVQPRHGSFPELIFATRGGYLFNPGDAEDLATNLNQLLTDSSTRTELGRRGQQKVVETFTAEAMARKTIDVYSQFTS